MATILEEIRSRVEQLSPEDQLRVLEFVQELKEHQKTLSSLPRSPLPLGTPGKALLRSSHSSEDAEVFERALQDSERIEVDEW